MYTDHEFDPITPDEEAQRRQDEEFARRVRREVRRMERGDADEDIRADEAQEAEEEALRETLRRKEHRRNASTFWQLFSGTILVREGMSHSYPYLLAIASMFLVSISVVFMSLHTDMRYMRLEREVQVLREKSIRWQERRFRCTTHSAITEELRRRGIELYDPLAPSEVIDN